MVSTFYWILLFIPEVHIIVVAGGFVSSSWNTNCWKSRKMCQPKQRIIFQPNLSSSLTFEENSTSDHGEVFVVNWEGCLADCVPWRTQVGIDAAFAVWPETAAYKDVVTATTPAFDTTTGQWLHNKLAAISHCLASTSTTTTTAVCNCDCYSATCDYALAARLLLEEQVLDGGESNGKSGKYASRFHPQQQQQQQQQQITKRDDNRELNRADAVSHEGRTSRPLTVGEISVNWSEGGMLRDVVQMRYHCNCQDPLPHLQTTVDSLLTSLTNQYDCPSIDVAIREALHTCKEYGRKLIVAVSHMSDLAVAQASLNDASIDHSLVSSAKEALENKNDVTVSLLVRSKSSIREILEESCAGSTVYVIDSSWRGLQDEIVLFGDYIPRQNGTAKCFAKTKNLSLCLAAWACHPTQQAAATMNPWTRSIDLTEVLEMISARIVS